jgi:hypothetical protein
MVNGETDGTDECESLKFGTGRSEDRLLLFLRKSGIRKLEIPHRRTMPNLKKMKACFHHHLLQVYLQDEQTKK